MSLVGWTADCVDDSRSRGISFINVDFGATQNTWRFFIKKFAPPMIRFWIILSYNLYHDH